MTLFLAVWAWLAGAALFFRWLGPPSAALVSVR